MNDELRQKLLRYQITTIAGVLFALMGFSYNVWRMEATEENNNVRMACFEILTELAALEQLVYSAHYDGDHTEGSPRKGWVKVGLIEDLSVLTAKSVEEEAAVLHTTWSENWSTYVQQETSVDKIVQAIESMRADIKHVLRELE